MTDHLRIKTVVNKYDLNKDSDSFIEQSFADEVNVAIVNLEDTDFEVLSVDITTLLDGAILLKTADITYNLTQEQADEEFSDGCDCDDFEDCDDDQDDEEPSKKSTKSERVVVVPSVGKHPRKVTEEVFTFVHEKAEDYTAEEIADFFGGKLSVWTINKILAVDSFDSYYAD